MVLSFSLNSLRILILGSGGRVILLCFFLQVAALFLCFSFIFHLSQMSQTPHCLFCWIRDGEVGWEPSSWMGLADFHCKVSSIFLPKFPAFDISLPPMYLVYTQLRDPVSLSPENIPPVFSWDRQEWLSNYTKGERWSQNLNLKLIFLLIFAIFLWWFLVLKILSESLFLDFPFCLRRVQFPQLCSILPFHLHFPASQMFVLSLWVGALKIIF